MFHSLCIFTAADTVGGLLIPCRLRLLGVKSGFQRSGLYLVTQWAPAYGEPAETELVAWPASVLACGCRLSLRCSCGDRGSAVNAQGAL